MDGSIRLSGFERKTALSIYRSGGDARVARRAHVLLLLERDWSYRQIMDALMCASDFVAAVKQRFLEAGFEAALAEGDDERPIPYWKAAVVGWVQHKTPRDFGYFRSRWTCELLAEVLWEEQGVRIGAESVRRALHELGFAWRRPRPVVGPTDPEYALTLRRIQRLLRTLQADEAAVFQDEVDVHLNPKIGCAWIRWASRRRSKRRATTSSGTWRGRWCGGLARCWSASLPSSETRSCLWPTWMTCDAGREASNRFM